MAMIIYAWLGDVSVGGLLIGAVVPGILRGLHMMIMVYFYPI